MYVLSDCNKSVLHHVTHSTVSDPDEVIQKIFLDEAEVFKTNYWLPGKHATGEDASLVIDLGCIKELNGVYLKNSHNAHKDNRGTSEFSLYVKEEESETWSRVSTEPGYLEPVYSYTVNKVQFISFAEVQMARYVKFTIDSYYGKGGGLSYFLESEGLAGSSYTSNMTSSLSPPDSNVTSRRL